MQRELFVYLDVKGAPVLVGRLWAITYATMPFCMTAPEMLLT